MPGDSFRGSVKPADPPARTPPPHAGGPAEAGGESTQTNAARDSFNQTSPWGELAPAGQGAFWLSVARALPGGWPWSRFALLARRAARRRLCPPDRPGRGRPALWAWRRRHRGVLAASAPPVDTRVWGLRLRLFPSRSVSEARILFLPESWDRRERTRLREWIRAGPADRFTFVDVGANVGGYSFWVLSVARRAARVIAVEPNPEIAGQLRYNVAANGAEDRMRVVEAAVGDAQGAGRLTVDAPNSGENRLMDAGRAELEPERRTVPVKVVALADLVRDAGLDRIDCLKVDVEGGQAAVIRPYLRSAPRALWPARMIVELKEPVERAPGSTSDASADSLGAWIESQGYRLTLRTKLNGLFELAETEQAGEFERAGEAEQAEAGARKHLTPAGSDNWRDHGRSG